MLPTLATGAIFIMTSSIAPSGDNPMMRMQESKYADGTPVVKIVDFNRVCNSCRRKGLNKKCSHVIQQPQHFQSHAGNERMEKLMDERSFRIEIQNEEEEPSISNAFEKEWIDSMVKNPYKLKVNVDYIMISLDPACGMFSFLSHSSES